MKSKSSFAVLTLLSLLFGVFVFFSFNGGVRTVEIVIISMIVLLGIGVTINTYAKEKKQKKGIIVEDELSEKIKTKSGSLSFHYSYFVWLIFIYLEVFGIELETWEIIGGGFFLNSMTFLIIKWYLNNKSYEE